MAKTAKTPSGKELLDLAAQTYAKPGYKPEPCATYRIRGCVRECCVLGAAALAKQNIKQAIGIGEAVAVLGLDIDFAEGVANGFLTGRGYYETKKTGRDRRGCGYRLGLRARKQFLGF